MRVEQGRVRLSARLEELPAWQDLVICSPPRHSAHVGLTSINFQGSIGGPSSDEYTRYSEYPTSPPLSSASMKIGSASVDKPYLKRQPIDAVFIPIKPSKAPVPRKSIRKPSAGGTQTQTEAVMDTARPVKEKAAPKQKPPQDPEDSATEVRTIVDIKVENDEDWLLRTPVNDTKGRAPPDKDSKTAKSAGPQQTENKGLQAYMDDGATPPTPAPVPRRRKSRINEDYHEPGEDTYSWQSRELSDAPYLLQRGSERDTHPEKPVKQQRRNEVSSNAPSRKNRGKRKAGDAMDVDEPVVSGKGAAKAVKTR